MEEDQSMPEMESIYSTFLASIRSVGTAVTMAFVGIYLHQRGFVVGDDKRTLALISQQVTFPLFLFTKIIYCNQDWSENPCPSVTQTLADDAWILLFWPIVVVGTGVLVGMMVVRFTRTPEHHIRSVLAACAFSNSTGLPITLLTVVHANFPATSDLGRIDPTLYLSVYLLLYPVLQWGFGGWLLAPPETNDTDSEEDEEEPNDEDCGNKPLTSAYESENTTGKRNQGQGNLRALPLAPRLDVNAPTNESNTSSSNGGSGVATNSDPAPTPARRRSSGGGTVSLPFQERFKHNVLNNAEAEAFYRHHRRGLSSSDEGLYISEMDLAGLAVQMEQLASAQQQRESYMQTRDENNNALALDSIPEGGGGGVFNERFSHSLPTSPGVETYRAIVGGGGNVPGTQNTASGNVAWGQSGQGPAPPSPYSTPPSSLGVQQIPLSPSSEQQPMLSPGNGGYLHNNSNHGTMNDAFSQSQRLMNCKRGQFDTETLWSTVKNILNRCFQPPVIGAVGGIFVAVTPLRGMFVDLVDRSSDAPLEWLFDGLYAVGQAAVPINMMILGCNLSASFSSQLGGASKVTSDEADGLLPWRTLYGIVAGKMFVMPLIGFALAAFLQAVLVISDETKGAFYLVLMIVFLTPTANNVMVMVELSGSGAKQGMARVIALQYAVAPIILSCTMTIAIGMASNWS